MFLGSCSQLAAGQDEELHRCRASFIRIRLYHFAEQAQKYIYKRYTFTNRRMFVKKLLLLFDSEHCFVGFFPLTTHLRSEESDYDRDTWQEVGWIVTVHTTQSFFLRVAVTLIQERNISAYGVNLCRIDWNKKQHKPQSPDQTYSHLLHCFWAENVLGWEYKSELDSRFTLTGHLLP